jgi:hypothetical protein
MHPVAEDLELYALKELASTKSSLIEIHLESCDSCRQLLREREEFAWQLRNLSEPDRTAACAEHRRSRRIPTDDPAIAKIMETDQEVSVDVRVVDVSAGGLCLQMPRAVRPGAVIQVYLANTIALGEVRYCIRSDEGFRLGVQVKDVFTTSLLVGKRSQAASE